MRKEALLFALCLGPAAMTGCGGGGGGGATAAPLVPASNPAATQSTPQSSTTQTANVAFSITIPSQSTASNARQLRYVSSATKSATVTVNGGAPQTVNCAQSCSFLFAAPLGTDTFVFRLYDGQNGAGNVLSTGGATAAVVAGKTNSVAVSLAGIVARLAVSLTPSSLPAGSRGSATVSVQAYDASGAVIAGSDPYATPITLSNSDTSGATSLSTTTLNTPSDPVTLTYTGSALSSATITASGGNAAPASATFSVTQQSQQTTASSSGPVVSFGGASCPVFPKTNSVSDEGAWNTDISGYPTDSNSDQYIAQQSQHTGHVQIAFATGKPGGGIPVNIVNVAPNQFQTMTFSSPSWMVAGDFGGTTSNPAMYPIPASAWIEGGPDAHLIVFDTANCHLYETWLNARNAPFNQANNGAVWDLTSGALRRDGTTSSDAAGLPIFPGLIRADEVRAGAINHALRFTMGGSAPRHIAPATHDAAGGNTEQWAFPMGLRLRLKASYDTSKLSGDALVVATALKHYGMFMADNGDDWTIDGADDPYFASSTIHQLQAIPSTAFEVVKTQ